MSTTAPPIWPWSWHVRRSGRRFCSSGFAGFTEGREQRADDASDHWSNEQETRHGVEGMHQGLHGGRSDGKRLVVLPWVAGFALGGGEVDFGQHRRYSDEAGHDGGPD